jgi:hypothetical protein
MDLCVDIVRMKRKDVGGVDFGILDRKEL